ncbi:MAG: divalent-cation tolerance protein CutA [Chlorobium sp.]|jgi:periplasmic divalent cation tolerance protein|uniref:divalent-cation tolerance protein CutA n=1 Tax=Chlorobium sp. TaxID=1095 RepID=UPI0025BA32BF|nr:divalent-cation tolerance protein CutA [Chlorobium sp.]MCF8215914.1 divalent-cation tolerance protein CutA [Chlorobium sp.]MCF8270812.1 divalent-cation tolerance protein CutA [Chlorobium sp.]MCF8287124.1 divalent-cation tolerance protein CutA [Chlorobium sp.]MCF8290781.1 divalent-cation tolerance protein CutA [Chlorobium sp.]MCF8384885.1 divalent-cation tolerance protein CutA [Chlorobium sp.]
MNEEYCMVITTIAGGEEAEELAEGILANRLAACVQMTGIRSFFLWEGEVQRETEMLLLIKTTTGRYNALESYISEYHPYDVPEIIRIPVTAGLSGYLSWLSSTTAFPG